MLSPEERLTVLSSGKGQIPPGLLETGVKCKACGNMRAKTVSACPQCGARTPAGKERAVVVILVALLLFGLAAAVVLILGLVWLLRRRAGAFTISLNCLEEVMVAPPVVALSSLSRVFRSQLRERA